MSAGTGTGSGGGGVISPYASGGTATAEYLGIHQYSPATLQGPTASTTTMAAFDSTNITTGNFTAPASGAVIVTFHCVLGLGTGNAAYGLAAHGTVSPIVGDIIILGSPTPALFQYAALSFYITGLTPGNTYAYDLLGAASTGSISISVLAQSSASPAFGSNGSAPVLATVEAAI